MLSDFESIYAHIKGLTLIEKDRCHMLYRLSRYASLLQPGNPQMAELGVFRGGSALLISRANPGAIMVAFDTFSGIPCADAANDGHVKGEFSIGAEDVEGRLRDAGLLVRKGIFPESLTPLDIEAKYCFAHFDGDTYQSCKDFLCFFWPRMLNGGILVFDDWDNPNCRGVNKAILEHCQNSGAYPFYTTKWQVALTVCHDAHSDA